MILSDSILAGAMILGFTALLQPFSRSVKVPYTVALLLLGFLFQFLTKQFGLPIHLELPTEFIYFFLLPLMLFESAFHINFHQFKIQFKTISFLATFGVLVAVMCTGAGLFWLLGIPLIDALLFGAIISATDPISVVALFKELGAPKRLTLLAEGESMFNDATGVIFFRIIAGFALAEQKFQTSAIISGISDFLYLFIGSLILGSVIGYLTAKFIAQIKNERLVEITLTVAITLMSFIVAEHFFHLSGVITVVAFGIVMGNLGRTKISPPVITFMSEFWEYLAFLGVALVFFFAAFELDLHIFQQEPRTLLTVTGITLVARAVSVYLGFFLTNNLPTFKNEPNVPMSWQHVMNWGGLRGIIPLVLAYSLPDDYAFKTPFITFTLACFFFTLFVNATTIRKLIIWLKLNQQQKTDAITAAEKELFEVNEARRRLQELPPEEFSRSVQIELEQEIKKREKISHQTLLDLATPKELDQSLRLEIISIERTCLERLFSLGHISERTVHEFTGELDIQQDALEHPELTALSGMNPTGRVASREQFRERLTKLIEAIQTFKWLEKWLSQSRRQLIQDRMSLLRARIVCGMEVMSYIDAVSSYFKSHPLANKVIQDIRGEQEQFLLKNTFQMDSLEREYPRMYQNFEREMVRGLVWQKEAETATHNG